MMTKIDDLPDDILVLIFNECYVEDVLSLRLTKRIFSHTIAIHINTIAPAAARQTFPGYIRLLRHGDEERDPEWYPRHYSIRWLKALIPKFLASTLVSSPDFH